MEFIKQGVRLFYNIYGEGETIVLLHGNGEDHTYFDKQIPFLVQIGYQVVVMDMRGHGQSSWGEEVLSFPLFASDVDALLEYLHIEKAHILGFSDGANTAMQFALSYPHRVVSLILYSGNVFPLGMKLPVFCAIYSSYLKYLLICRKQKQERQRLALMALHPHISWKNLANIEVPTYVIAGENDMIRTSHTKKIATTISNASLTILSKGDHFIAQKQADRFNVSIEKFLEETTYGR